MKKFTSLLISCSLALAGAALAQQPEEQQSPTKKHGAEKTHAEAKPGATAAKPEAGAAKQHGAKNEPGTMKQPGTTKEPGTMKEAGPTTEPSAAKGRKARATEKSATAPGTNVSGEAAASATPGAKHEAGQRHKGMKASPSPAAAAAAASAAPAGAAGATGAKPATGAAAGATTKKVEPQKVQQVKAQAAQIKQQHTNFHAQAKPQQVQSVTFNQTYRIQGAEQWQGPQYEVFRSYHPEWHDQGWYRSHYGRVELIGGGWYFWNSGYWYPAWGYDPAAAYYAYDAPIYVGQRAEPPDQVIADVQAELQQMGYYTGEVDGLLGPLTREALASYQADQGLTPTAMIDEPTLGSLGLA